MRAARMSSYAGAQRTLRASAVQRKLHATLSARRFRAAATYDGGSHMCRLRLGCVPPRDSMSASDGFDECSAMLDSRNRDQLRTLKRL
eukprot:6175830-Pleurochrysis_carterae.AAC.3